MVSRYIRMVMQEHPDHSLLEASQHFLRSEQLYLSSTDTLCPQ